MELKEPYFYVSNQNLNLPSLWTPIPGWFPAPLAQDIQVNRRVLDQGQQAAVDVLDDHPLLGLPLPAALHQQVHLLGASARPFQFPSLRDAFDGLLGGNLKWQYIIAYLSSVTPGQMRHCISLI